MDAHVPLTVYTSIEQLLVPAALVLASWQVLRRSARRPAFQRALLMPPLRALATLGGKWPLGDWAERRLALLTVAPAGTAVGAAACASGCGSCGGCATPGPTGGTAAPSGPAVPQPVRWLGRTGA